MNLFLCGRALDRLHYLHYGDDADAQAQGDEVLSDADGSKVDEKALNSIGAVKGLFREKLRVIGPRGCRNTQDPFTKRS